MTIAVVTFCGVTLLILCIYWLLVLRPESAEQAALKRRVKGRVVSRQERLSISADYKPLSEIPALAAALGRSRSLTRVPQDLIDKSGVRLTVGAFYLLSAFLAAAAFTALRFLGSPGVVSLLVGGAAACIPYLYLRYKVDKRMSRFEELFPEALGLIVRALRAGHAFTTGLGMAAEEMDDPVGPEFRILYDQQNFGMPLEDALRQMAERVPLIDVKFFVTAVLTQRQAGGNLAEVLENLIAVVRDRFKVKRQVRTVTAHARISGLVLMLLPPTCAVLLLIIAPAHMRLLWTDSIGLRMLTLGIVLQVVGVVAIRRIIRIEY